MQLQQFHAPRAATRFVGRARVVLRAIKDRRFVGTYELQCPICGLTGLFEWYGDPPRRDAQCPSCRSLERHRLLKLWFDRNEARLRGGTALHFAPEPGVIRIFKPAAGRYVTADIAPERADLVLDIEDMRDEAPETYDWILCSHVLEHVDDRKALRELRRILKPEGMLIIMIPIVEGWRATLEDDDVRSAGHRARYFGQFDHVRYYGSDVRDRIAEAGFALDEFTAAEPDVSRYGLTRGEKVFVATRR
jgi:SAM-dependent methyltransferase